MERHNLIRRDPGACVHLPHARRGAATLRDGSDTRKVQVDANGLWRPTEADWEWLRGRTHLSIGAGVQIRLYASRFDVG